MGTGSLVGKVTVDQVYAKYQHERLDLRHPGGGQAKYLSTPLKRGAARFFQRVADTVTTGAGTTPAGAMSRNAEDLSSDLYAYAPFEFGDLKASGHPQVFDQGRRVYDRRPLRERLSKDELSVKSYLRSIGLGNR